MNDRPPVTQAARPPEIGMSICVLASGSSGNCTVLVSRPDSEAPRRVILIDAGLSPRRTGGLLLERGIRPDEVDDIVFTHLDSDHCHAGWRVAIRPGGWRARLRIHRRHMGRAERAGLLFSHTQPFEESIELDPRLRVDVTTLSHDDLGVAAFRFVASTPAGEGHLGFATDLGRTTDALIGLLHGVDVLALESNYCPVLQVDSDRPAYLKQRIMGGSGHLSNREAADTARAIAPRERLVLLHLSRQCNTPDTALVAHRGAACPVEISDQFTPTPWIPIVGCPARTVEPKPDAPKRRARSLFELPGTGGSAW